MLVKSSNAVGRSLRVAGVSQVVECSWANVVGSWCRSSRQMQLDDRCGKLVSVKSSDAVGRSLRVAGVGHLVECSWTIVVGSWCQSSRRMQLEDRFG